MTKDSEAYCLPLLLLPISASVNLEKAQMELSPHTLPIPKLFTITEKSYSKSNQFRKKEGGGRKDVYVFSYFAENLQTLCSPQAGVQVK